jgi:hypothetical protein
MLPGYNHNVNYKGTVFHIQTEDSGVENPHIITLLYIKGNIVARKKISYADIVKHERMEDVVRELMQEQHKTMLRDLKIGTFDIHPLVLQAWGKPIPAAARPAAAAAKPAAPTPPPPPPAFAEKPAEKTITLKEGEELRDEDIFGADIISNKSLDEVILSYLAQESKEDE